MTTILFVWELGGGLGHISQFAPLATALADNGHRVFVALRDLSAAAPFFARSKVQMLAAPYRPRRVEPGYTTTVSFAHILHNVGFGDDVSLAAHASAWRNLYRLIRPDAIVFDHSPTALLAARGAPARRVVLGSGFCVPPDTFPLAPLRPWLAADPQRLGEDERPVLARVNRLLEHWKQPPLQRLGQLFSEVDQTLLTTFRELDHYSGRCNGEYVGPVNATGGAPPEWPAGCGRKVFAYLKNFPAAPQLLQFLNQRGLPTLVYPDGIPPQMMRRFASSTLRFQTRRPDTSRVAQECDVGITNANHGTTAALLMAGKPLLAVPLVIEQAVTARRVRELGVGQDAPARNPERLVQRFCELLESDTFFQAARGLAGCLTLDPARQRQQMLRSVEAALDSPRAMTEVASA